jgi:hypothetical protein
MKSLGHNHWHEELWLFIDTSKVSLKGVLFLEEINFNQSLFSKQLRLRKRYENMKLLLTCIQYNIHCWNICGDLKVTALLVGMLLGFTEFCCFLYEWDSWAKDVTNLQKDGPKVSNFKHNRTSETNRLYIQTKHFYLHYILSLVWWTILSELWTTTERHFNICSRNFHKSLNQKSKKEFYEGNDLIHCPGRLRKLLRKCWK